MKFDDIASLETAKKVIEALKERGIEGEIAATGKDALLRIQSLIPKGASVMNGSSRTLDEIGFTEYLRSGAHGWDNLHEKILLEKDPAKQAILRTQSVISDHYLGSVHAIAETGELLIASNSGSQLPHIVFTSQNIIFVVGMQKIVPTLADAWKRLEEHVMPLEDVRLMQVYGMHTAASKVLVIQKEHPMMGRKVRVILVNEKLGY
jgi:L-lactate utilization protein LutC